MEAVWSSVQSGFLQSSSMHWQTVQSDHLDRGEPSAPSTRQCTSAWHTQCSHKTRGLLRGDRWLDILNREMLNLITIKNLTKRGIAAPLRKSRKLRQCCVASSQNLSSTCTTINRVPTSTDSDYLLQHTDEQWCTDNSTCVRKLGD